MSAVDSRLVVVDDEPDSAAALQALLELDGYDVRTANDAEQALRVVAEHEPYCVLLDLGLPQVDGCELARLLRQRYGGSLTLLAVTGWSRLEDREEAERAGVDYVLRKPVMAETLRKFFPPV